MTLIIDEIQNSLDFHIFDVLDLDLLLGSPLEKLFETSLGSLDDEFREAASATTTPCLGHFMVKLLPKQNSLEKTTYISSFTSSEHLLIEIAESSNSHEYDSGEILHPCEDERSSSLSTDFEPLPAGPHHVVFLIMIESQHRSSMMVPLRWRIHGPWNLVRHGLWNSYERIPLTNMVDSLLIYHMNHACITPLQSRTCVVHCAHTRATTTFWSSFARSLEG
jgi:hypothetical protein